MYPSEDSPSPYPPPQGRYATVKTASQRPVVSYALLGVTVVVFLLQLVSPYLPLDYNQLTELLMNATGVDPVAALGMKVNELIIAGQIWRLITPVVLHASILHLGFNMYALYVLGPGLELHYGSARFLGLYLLSGFVGNVSSFWFSSSPSLGASTAVFGLIGAQGVFLYQNRSVFGAQAQRALMQVVMIAAINLVFGASAPGIDNWGHVGGLVGGTLFAWFAGPLLRVDRGLFAPQVADERDEGDALRAGLAIAGLFAFLAALRIFLGR